VKYCGREFSDTDLNKIREIISVNPEYHRNKISVKICEAFEWRKPDGDYKTMSCRVAMLRMHRSGVIKLPPPRRKFAPIKPFRRRTTEADPGKPVVTPVQNLQGLKLRLVANRDSMLWNEYVERYHYLGFKRLPGAQLRYFVDSNNGILALLGFGAAAWMTAPRDQHIGWSDQKRRQNLHLVVNNARLLVLPWIKCPNLISWIFGRIYKQLPADWEKRYKYRPVLLETFVEDKKFLGSCYKASNWQYLGKTQGRGKLGNKKNSIPIKSVWVYPLKNYFRKYLIQ